MEQDISNYLSDQSIDSSIIGNICGALTKMMTIFQFCGYNIEKYINNYYEYANPYDYHWSVTSLFYLVSKNGNIIDDKQLEKMKQDHENEFAKIMAFFEKHGMIFDKYTDEPQRHTDYIACHMEYDKLLKDDNFRRMIRSAMRMHMIDIATLDPEKYQESDYTYLMVNYVKSLESFIFYKLNKYKPFNSYESKHLTFGDLEIKLKSYINKNVKDIPQGLLNQYTKLLSKFREVYRNGYFHRDIQERKKAYMANEIAMILIIMTEMIVDV